MASGTTTIFCDDEIALFQQFIKAILFYDPDILLGYEIQMASLGLLIERASVNGTTLHH